jgi:hypothetical protein
MVSASQASRALASRIHREIFKISIYLWVLARHIQLNSPIALRRGDILQITSLKGEGPTEYRVINGAIHHGMLTRKGYGLYIPNYEVADTLVHRIPIGVAEGQHIDHSAENKLWREAIRLRHAWADFVRWAGAGMKPTEVPVESIAVLESFGIRPFVEVRAPNGLTAYTVQFKDLYLITKGLSNSVFASCTDFPEQGQGAKLCAIKRDVLKEYLVP